MKLAIMQPYFLPYIGYFQLIAAVDVFVVYDNIKYTKKGWINRNRMLQNGQDAMFSLPLKKDSDSLDVVQRELAADFSRDKLLNQFKGAYGQAPHFAETFAAAGAHRALRRQQPVPLHSSCPCRDLCRTSASIPRFASRRRSRIDHELKGQDKVLALCQAVGADTYINAIGGTELYSTRGHSGAQGIELKFIRSKPLSMRSSVRRSCLGCRS